VAKKKHSNTEALRSEFSRQLANAIKDISRNTAANKLGISRQMLRLYLNGSATPGGEVIKKACDEWGLSLSIKGFQFSGDDFAGEPVPRKRGRKTEQISLFALLEGLKANQLEAEITGRQGNSFCLTLRIKVAA
jgi:transcriptional regulator with XRE-family HTH domain